jgi:hypothetical protein
LVLLGVSTLPLRLLLGFDFLHLLSTHPRYELPILIPVTLSVVRENGLAVVVCEVGFGLAALSFLAQRGRRRMKYVEGLLLGDDIRPQE